MSLEVGGTFVIGDQKWSIKFVDLDGTHPQNKSGEPRVNASKFYVDEDGEEKVRKGRPSKFSVPEVCSALGIDVPEGYKEPAASLGTFKGFAPTDDVDDEWDALHQEANRSVVEELINSTFDDF